MIPWPVRAGRLVWKMPVLAAENLQKTYVTGEARVTALAGVSFDGRSRRFRRADGAVRLRQVDAAALSAARWIARPAARSASTIAISSSMGDDELTRVRREQVGFVFQFFNLLPTLTVGDNIALPCLLAGMKDQRRRTPRAGAGRTGRHRASPDALPAADLRRRNAARRDRARARPSAVAARRR